MHHEPTDPPSLLPLPPGEGEQGKVLKGNTRHQFNLPSDWLGPAVPLVPAQLDCCAGGSQGCPLRSRCRTNSKYIINAQLPLVARGSVSWLEVGGIFGGFGSLLSSGGRGGNGPGVVAPLSSQLFIPLFSSGGVVRTNGYFQTHL